VVVMYLMASQLKESIRFISIIKAHFKQVLQTSVRVWHVGQQCSSSDESVVCCYRHVTHCTAHRWRLRRRQSAPKRPLWNGRDSRGPNGGTATIGPTSTPPAAHRQGAYHVLCTRAMKCWEYKACHNFLKGASILKRPVGYAHLCCDFGDFVIGRAYFSTSPPYGGRCSSVYNAYAPLHFQAADPAAPLSQPSWQDLCRE
jgi:hypothetical protein